MAIEALLYEPLYDGAVRCGTCQRRCIIPPGKAGWCGTRHNEDGTLVSSIYGEVSSVSINPIEKKPVFHFHPGSLWLSLGTMGCNFRCPGCQNWTLSHGRRRRHHTQYLSPADAVAAAKAAGCLGISWTFNEPTIWLEYTLDGAKVAKREGLCTNYVTNGAITDEALEVIAPHLDVFRVDIKGFSDTTYDRIGHLPAARGIREAACKAKAHGLHVEVVTNIIPRINDSDEELRNIAEWIGGALGRETPWHVTRFFPHWRLADLPPTPIARLESAREIGVAAGLWYVYVGNVPGHEWENTYCHTCGALLIERRVFDVLRNEIEDGHCPTCDERIPGRFSSPLP